MKTIGVKGGINLKVKGEATKLVQNPPMASTYCVKPTDFLYIKPKLVVEVGTNVKAGSVLFYDKNHKEVKFCSPVSGEVVEIVRGAKRVIQKIVILADKEIEYIDLEMTTSGSATEETVRTDLLKSGLWPFLIQRPFGCIPDPESKPELIHITSFDTSPMPHDIEFVTLNDFVPFQEGINILKKLCNRIHLGVSQNGFTNNIFFRTKNLTLHSFKTKHPSGNVGYQLSKTNPISKNCVAWTIHPQDVINLGRTFIQKKYVAEKIISLCGSMLKNPSYFRVLNGSSFKLLMDKQLESNNVRIISGNVFSGTQVEKDDFLGFYDYKISVLPEDKEMEFFGWLFPSFKKYSCYRNFPSWMYPSKKYDLNTKVHGEERPFVVSGIYERVLDMDIFPVYLIKAILAGDIEKMEQLGIYEVCEEDFAVLEFVCPSKINFQSILREGLDMLRKEYSVTEN